MGLFPNRKTSLENVKKQRALNVNHKNYSLDSKKKVRPQPAFHFRCDLFFERLPDFGESEGLPSVCDSTKTAVSEISRVHPDLSYGIQHSIQSSCERYVSLYFLLLAQGFVYLFDRLLSLCRSLLLLLCPPVTQSTLHRESPANVQTCLATKEPCPPCWPPSGCLWCKALSCHCYPTATCPVTPASGT